MKTFEQAIRDNAHRSDNPAIVNKTDDGVYLGGSEYILRVQSFDETGLHIYIRPANRDGETVDFIVVGNELTRRSPDFAMSVEQPLAVQAQIIQSVEGCQKKA